MTEDETQDQAPASRDCYSRREFLRIAAVAGATVGVGAGLGSVLASCAGEAGSTKTTAVGTTTSSGVSETSGGVITTAGPTTRTTARAGGLTVGTTEGPYYITGAAELTAGDLNYADLPGEPIKVRGHVYGGADTSTPLAGAKIEIWHADSDGSYHPNTNGDAAQFGPDELALRGYVLADQAGYYEFTSIYPGQYPGRTRHIHVRASATDYGAIVSQIIVPAKGGDSVTPETDNIATSLPAANLVTFTQNDGGLETTFDFHLGSD